jgi:threonine 3-dehydrogenase
MTFNAVIKCDAAPGGLELRRRDLPSDLGPLDVLVEVATAGICGTDLTLWKWPVWLSERMGDRLPVVIGHEFCGYVRQVGSKVTTVDVGQYVSVESHSSCGRCINCLIGRENICEHLEYVGLDIDGGFAEYAILPVNVIRPIPQEIPLESAALLEPFTLAVRAVLADGGVEGKTVLITGMGPLGLMTYAAARAYGAQTVVGVESTPYRLQLAREYADEVGCGVVLGSDETDGGDRVRKLTGGRGADVWFDYSGAESALSVGLRALAVGGEARLLGAPFGSVNIDLSTAVMKEIRIRTFHGRDMAGSWQHAISLLVERRVDLTPLITHRVTLPEYSKAFDLLFEQRACKVLIDVNV